MKGSALISQPVAHVRFCVQIPMYNVTRFILAAIENAAPYVERIYLTWSPSPWTHYNSGSRLQHRNPTPVEIVDGSPWLDKLTIIRGDWQREEDQRNAALDRAVADGFDVMIVQDADEFYTGADYVANLRFMAENRNCDFYKAKWRVFWKTADYVIDTFQEGLLTNCENFAVNLGRGIRFRERRICDGTAFLTVPGVCCHLSYVLSNDEVREKLATWGHAHQTKPEIWFERKWIHWTPRTRNLCPINFPAIFRRAVPFTGDRPDGFTKIDIPKLVIRPAPLISRAWWWCMDFKDLAHLALHRLAVRGLLSWRAQRARGGNR